MTPSAVLAVSAVSCTAMALLPFAFVEAIDVPPPPYYNEVDEGDEEPQVAITLTLEPPVLAPEDPDIFASIAVFLLSETPLGAIELSIVNSTGASVMVEKAFGGLLDLNDENGPQFTLLTELSDFLLFANDNSQEWATQNLPMPLFLFHLGLSESALITNSAICISSAGGIGGDPITTFEVTGECTDSSVLESSPPFPSTVPSLPSPAPFVEIFVAVIFDTDVVVQLFMISNVPVYEVLFGLGAIAPGNTQKIVGVFVTGTQGLAQEFFGPGSVQNLSLNSAQALGNGTQSIPPQPSLQLVFELGVNTFNLNDDDELCILNFNVETEENVQPSTDFLFCISPPSPPAPILPPASPLPPNSPPFLAAVELSFSISQLWTVMPVQSLETPLLAQVEVELLSNTPVSQVSFGFAVDVIVIDEILNQNENVSGISLTTVTDEIFGAVNQVEVNITGIGNEDPIASPAPLFSMNVSINLASALENDLLTGDLQLLQSTGENESDSDIVQGFIAVCPNSAQILPDGTGLVIQCKPGVTIQLLVLAPPDLPSPLPPGQLLPPPGNSELPGDMSNGGSSSNGTSTIKLLLIYGLSGLAIGVLLMLIPFFIVTRRKRQPLIRHRHDSSHSEGHVEMSRVDPALIFAPQTIQDVHHFFSRQGVKWCSCMIAVDFSKPRNSFDNESTNENSTAEAISCSIRAIEPFMRLSSSSSSLLSIEAYGFGDESAPAIGYTLSSILGRYLSLCQVVNAGDQASLIPVIRQARHNIDSNSTYPFSVVYVFTTGGINESNLDAAEEELISHRKSSFCVVVVGIGNSSFASLKGLASSLKAKGCFNFEFVSWNSIIASQASADIESAFAASALKRLPRLYRSLTAPSSPSLNPNRQPLQSDTARQPLPPPDSEERRSPEGQRRGLGNTYITAGFNSHHSNSKSEAGGGDQDDDRDIPQEFFCPITQELMQDPVVAGDGISYERNAIECWLQDNHTSPITREPMSSRVLISNFNLKSQIESLSTEANK